jgi:hypothetical protein
MTLLDTAIRAACAADPNFALNRKPKLAQAALEFCACFPDANAEAVYIHAQQKPAWRDAGPKARSAWEIFRATLRILWEAEAREAEKSRATRVLHAVPDWMRDGDDEPFYGLSDTIFPPRPRAPIPLAPLPAPDPAPLSERKRSGKRG